MIRILHCADLHLDASFASSGLPPTAGSWRRDNLRATLGRILALRNVSTIVRQFASEFREQSPSRNCSRAVDMWTTENDIGCPHTHSHYDDCGRLIQTSSGKDGGLGSPRTKRSGCTA